jgi:mannose-6-phosphate isomerase-like protein (cupin superfamily)
MVDARTVQPQFEPRYSTSAATACWAADVTSPQGDKVNLSDKLGQFTEKWSPRIIGELNGQHVKLVKVEGEFIWHQHADEDELFLVLSGQLSIHLRDRTIDLEEGEFFIVPRGVEHKPVAESETHVLVFEPASTLNTGNVRSERTVESPEAL